MQHCLASLAMKPIHIIQGDPKSFAKFANSLIRQRDVALLLIAVSCHGGVLAGVLEEQPMSKNSPGALVKVRAAEVEHAAGAVSELAGEDGIWKVHSVFAGLPAPLPEIEAKVDGRGKGKGKGESKGDEQSEAKEEDQPKLQPALGTILVAVQTQP